MVQTLVALDTDHIKQFVFATNRLKEIRGASSILDNLNRRTMEEVAENFEAKRVYTNGGSGMFLIEGDEHVAEEFGQRVQKAYTFTTKGGSSISFAVQRLPDGIDPWHDGRVHAYLNLLSYRLLQAKVSPVQFAGLPSHPFMRPCDACGIQYAEGLDRNDSPDPTDRDKRYCGACLAKRQEDSRVKDSIHRIINEPEKNNDTSYIWQQIVQLLPPEYEIPEGTVRPSDFNELRGISGGKEYLALIYADGNGMGKEIGKCKNLTDRKQKAKLIDRGVYKALSSAIAKHLPVVPAGELGQPPMFPFDILLIGGDDIIIVTPAAQAMDVALTIAKEFHTATSNPTSDSRSDGSTLSIGVVLAPIKYPFGLLYELAESTLKFAKKEGARRKATSAYGNTRINFLVVAGTTSHDFGTVYNHLHRKPGAENGSAFYATLRPYTVEDLEILLDVIRDGRQRLLGRTKLHQMREAVLKMNLTTSVGEALTVLRNWRDRQRDFVVTQVYTLANRYQEQHHLPDHPGSLFPRVTFPWFADGSDAYRTSLLDFIELYDFVAREEDASGQ